MLYATPSKRGGLTVTMLLPCGVQAHIRHHSSLVDILLGPPRPDGAL
jgi:hypothetical protein